MYDEIQSSESMKIKLIPAIENSLAYLSGNQLEYGEFRTYIAKDPELKTSQFDSSPFVTAQALYSLSFLENQRAEEMMKKGTSFLLEEMTGEGLWQYWSKRHEKKMIPDLDDTCCASFVLRKRIPDIYAQNEKIILNNRNSGGLFKTWIREPSYPRNDVDSVVNANVLLYLGEKEETAAACRYLIDIIRENRESGTHKYYIDNFSLYYAVSRAYFQGIKALGTLVPMLASKAVHLQKGDGSFGNELLTGLALNTLLNIGYDKGPTLKSAVHYLLEHQQRDGSFRRIAFYHWPESPSEIIFWFGSEELTTSICLEALARYFIRITGPC